MCAEHIVIEERDEHSDKGKRQQGVDVLTAKYKGDAVADKGKDAQTGGQTIDAVDEVDGIDDEYHGKRGEGDNRPLRP